MRDQNSKFKVQSMKHNVSRLTSYVLVIMFLITACSPKATQVRPEEPATAVYISSLEIGKSDARSILSIKATEPLQGNYTVIKVSDPPKLVIEMPTVEVGKFEGSIDAVNGVIAKVTTSRLNTTGTMMEVNLVSLVEHEVKAEGSSLEIYFAEPQIAEAPKVEEKIEITPQEKVEVAPEEMAQAPAEVVEEPKIEEKVEALQKAIKVKAVEIKKDGKFTRAEIIIDGDISDYNVFDLTSPDRVVVDIRNAREISAKRDIKAISPHIKGARLGRYDGQVRVVFDYKGSVKPYEVVKENDRISILFGKTSSTVIAKVEKAALKEEVSKAEEKVDVEIKPETAIVETEPTVAEAVPTAEMKAAEVTPEKLEEKVEVEVKAEEIPQEKPQSPAEIVEEPKKEETVKDSQKVVKVKAVEIKKAGKFTKAEIITDGELSTFKVYDLKSPDRVIVDIMNARDISAKKSIKAVSSHIKGARLGRHDGQVRVVFDYKGSIKPYEIVKGNDRISILFGKKPAVEAAKVEMSAAKEEVPKIEEMAEEKAAEEATADVPIAKAGPEAVEAMPEVKEEVKTETKAESPKEEAKVEDASAKPVEVAAEVKPEVAKEEVKVEVKSKVEEAKVKPRVETEIKENAKEEIKAEEKTAVKEKAAAAPVVAVKVEEKTEPEAEKKTAAEGASEEISKVYNGQKVTLEFNNADIKQIFRIIAEVSGYNMIIDNAVAGKVTIRLVNVPWDQALDILLETNNLGMKKVGNVIRVVPAALVKKEEEEKLAGKKAKEKLEDMVTKLIPVSYAKAGDLSTKIKSVMTDRGTAMVDDRTNTIILKDIQKSVDEAEKLVKDLDTPTAQIMIEARIIEANTGFARNLGVQWGAGYTADAAHGNPTGYYFPNSYNLTASGGGVAGAINPAIGQTGGNVGINFGSINNTLNLDLRLQALEAQSQGKIISSPKIITLDNKEASIQQGVSIPFETTSSSGTQTVFIDANLNLTVTPHVTADGKISMKVKASNNSPSTIKGASGAPGIEKKEANTEILVKDGDTTVIGGIYTIAKRESETYTPFLGKIPIIGWLFKSKDKNETKTELLIFITPRIVRDNSTIKEAVNK